ncbi:fumarylacetoacetate hydrolase family protein [Actinocorallia sp. A-T 12471]|uniref:fumarylacetoacetate hydrolase family protein n=1 Tax=Actinocorallia sp. A-T 12471 TaxID=3089813 RepID=UPI0029CE2E57|nr:fumarylacetoacetate hydrolase family protein [Actinocorallia sp. A-T 12471]MDX6740003.1 fumarylacetoacetate hydrolase family protein [Actinocorallia sp. A-T 12471]
MFDAETLPFGVFTALDRPGVRRVGVAVEDRVLDLSQARIPHPALFAYGSLDPFLVSGPEVWDRVRSALLEGAGGPYLPMSEVTMCLPFTVADYVDFYASEYHAANLGRLFRPGGDPLTHNWRYQPLAYHGRAGTVVVSGTAIVRPSGPHLIEGGSEPVFGPSERLDLEAELGFVVGVPSALGTPVPTGAFADHVFGICLVNDWSARDLQAWEYLPLGPFLGKSFATSVSPWVVPLAALGDARVPVPSGSGNLAPYLREDAPWGLDITLEVRLNGEPISRPPYRSTHWSPAQMVAHLTANGAALRPGDLIASGTVSGPGGEEVGSLIELTHGGERPVVLPGGVTRTWIEDYDEVAISASLAGGRYLGEVSGRVLPAVV